MELVRPAATRQLGGDLVDSLGDDQRRSVDSLGQKVSKWPVETSGQHHSLAILRHDCERAIDAENSFDITSEQPAPRFRFVDRPEAL